MMDIGAARAQSLVAALVSLYIAWEYVSLRFDAIGENELVCVAMLLLTAYGVLSSTRRRGGSGEDDDDDLTNAYALLSPIWALCATSGSVLGEKSARAFALNNAFSVAGSIGYVDAWSATTDARRTLVSAIGWFVALRLISGKWALDAFAVALARCASWRLGDAFSALERGFVALGVAGTFGACGYAYSSGIGFKRATDATVLGSTFMISGLAWLSASARLVSGSSRAGPWTRAIAIASALAAPELYYRIVTGSGNVLSALITYVLTTTQTTELLALSTRWATALCVAFGSALTVRSAPLTIRRKAFHFLAVFMFAPLLLPSSHHGELLRVAFTVAFALFAFVEFARVYDAFYGVGSFGWPLSFFLAEHFVPQPNVVSLIITDHISLLIGIALPTWLSADTSSLVPWAGILTVGVGDSLASVVGTAFGRRRLFADERHGKTLEGACAFAISTFAAASYVAAQVGSDASTARILFSSVASAVVEASCERGDNYILPLVFAALVASR